MPRPKKPTPCPPPLFLHWWRPRRPLENRNRSCTISDMNRETEILLRQARALAEDQRRELVQELLLTLGPERDRADEVREPVRPLRPPARQASGSEIRPAAVLSGGRPWRTSAPSLGCACSPAIRFSISARKNAPDLPRHLGPHSRPSCRKRAATTRNPSCRARGCDCHQLAHPHRVSDCPRPLAQARLAVGVSAGPAGGYPGRSDSGSAFCGWFRSSRTISRRPLRWRAAARSVLRTLDALHLAVAASLGCRLATFDTRLAAAAEGERVQQRRFAGLGAPLSGPVCGGS